MFEFIRVYLSQTEGKDLNGPRAVPPGERAVSLARLELRRGADRKVGEARQGGLRGANKSLCSLEGGQASKGLEKAFQKLARSSSRAVCSSRASIQPELLGFHLLPLDAQQQQPGPAKAKIAFY